jgi:glycosyltransferase involved in cell wall biosynthesis
MRRQGVTHFHAHWATEAATVAVIFSWLTRIPFSFTAHAYDIYRSPQFFDLKLREAAFAVTVSKYNRQYIAEHFGPDHIDKIHVIYPLIDLAQFPLRPKDPTGLGDPSGLARLIIITVGRLTEYKGLIHLVEACRILQERGLAFECQIVGQGEDQPLLEEAVARYGLQAEVKLLGPLPHDAIPPLLEQATLFALPCVIAPDGDRDGMPLVLIEAMARGLPVVSSNLIGLPELVRDGAGVLVPPGDPAALADAIQRIGQLSPEAREAMGRAGRRIVEDFDATQGAARLLELIRAVERGHAARPALVEKAAGHAKPAV